MYIWEGVSPECLKSMPMADPCTKTGVNRNVVEPLTTNMTSMHIIIELEQHIIELEPHN